MMGAEVGDGMLDGFPCGVLGEVGTEYDFEGGFCGPPLLGTPNLDEAVVHRAEAAGGGHGTGYRVQGQGQGQGYGLRLRMAHWTAFWWGDRAVEFANHNR